MNEKKLAELIDKSEITDVLNEYARAIDEFRFKDMEALFTDDIDIHFPQFRMKGRSGFAEKLAEAVEGTEFMQHASFNFQIEVNGDTATSRENCVSYGKHRDNPSLMTEGGIYDHKFRRINGAWMISYIRFTMTFAEGFLPDHPAVS